jgi:hypothetical protein
MKNRKAFTIGGSVELREALVKSAKLDPKNLCIAFKSNMFEDGLGKNNLLIHKPDAGDTDWYLSYCDRQLALHYNLPEQYNEALQAVKDFFAEEKFEKGKWYYGEFGGCKTLAKYSHPVFTQNIWSEVVRVKEDHSVEYSLHCTVNSDNWESKNLQAATIEQIQLMLGKVAEQKGYKPKVVIKNDNDIEYTLVEGYTPGYFHFSDSFNCCGYRVYWDGKWAEILPNKEVKKEEDTVELILNKIITHSNKLRPDETGHGIVIALAKYALELMEPRQ